jgi:hypothetical protein
LSFIAFLTLDSLDINDQTGILVSFDLYSSNKYSNYYRNYLKISEIIASIGGLINVSIIIFSYINLPFSRLNKNIYAINKLLDVDNLANNNNSVNKSNSVIEKDTLKEFINTKIINIKPSSNICVRMNNISQKKRYTDTTGKVMKIFKNRINLSFNYSERFKLFLCRRCSKSFSQELANKSQKYGVGVHFIDSFFDLVRIIKRLIEFDLLKKVIFSKDQNELFDLLNKIKSNDRTDIVLINTFHF